MNGRKLKTPESCSESEISFYVDGEMAREEAERFELHLKRCKSCRTSVTEQKNFLLALNNSLESDRDLSVPPNFTRAIVASAESDVSGIRRRRELVPALAVVSLLVLAVIALLGVQSRDAFSVAGETAEKVSFVAILALRTIYSLAVGATHFIRTTIAGQPLAAILLCLAVAAVAILAVRNISKPAGRFFKI